MKTIKTNAGPAGLGRATRMCIRSSVEKREDLSRPRCTESLQLSHLGRRASILEMIARGPSQPSAPPFSEAASATELAKRRLVAGVQARECCRVCSETAPVILSCTDANFASATPSAVRTVKSIQLKWFGASINGQDWRTGRS